MRKLIMDGLMWKVTEGEDKQVTDRKLWSKWLDQYRYHQGHCKLKKSLVCLSVCLSVKFHIFS